MAGARERSDASLSHLCTSDTDGTWMRLHRSPRGWMLRRSKRSTNWRRDTIARDPGLLRRQFDNLPNVKRKCWPSLRKASGRRARNLWSRRKRCWIGSTPSEKRFGPSEIKKLRDAGSLVPSFARRSERRYRSSGRCGFQDGGRPARRSCQSDLLSCYFTSSRSTARRARPTKMAPWKAAICSALPRRYQARSDSTHRPSP